MLDIEKGLGVRSEIKTQKYYMSKTTNLLKCNTLNLLKHTAVDIVKDM